MTPTVAFHRALIYGLAACALVAVVGAAIGGMVAGTPGVVSAFISVGIGVLLVAITAGSLLVGARVVERDPGSPLYLGIMLGAWVVKFGLFLVALLLLRDQPFIDQYVLFFTLVAVVVGGVAADVVAVLRTRIPVIPDRTEGPQAGA